MKIIPEKDVDDAPPPSSRDGARCGRAASRDADSLSQEDSFQDDPQELEDFMLEDLTLEKQQAKGAGAASHRGEAQEELQELIRQLARDVQRWRLILFFCMLTFATIVSTGVFIYLRNTQTLDFESGFKANALELIDNFNAEAAKQLEILNPLATAYTSYALSHNLTFPFVTLPDFAYRASNVQVLANVLQVRYMPIIFDDETRLKWEEEYAIQHYHHVVNSYQDEVDSIQRQDALYYDQKKTTTTRQEAGERKRNLQPARNENEEEEQRIAWEGLRNLTNSTLPFQLEDGYYTRIRDDELLIPYNGGPYVPLWQVSHATNVGVENLNDDLGSSLIFGGLAARIIQDPKAGIGPIRSPGPRILPSLQHKLQYSQYRYDLEKYLSQPTAFFAVPIFDRFDDQKKVVGILTTNVYWRISFLNVLPPDAEGYICVLKNSFGQTATFRIDGATNVTFLTDEMDLHDPSYNDQGLMATMNTFIQQQQSPHTTAYTSSILNGAVYELLVYPSKDTEMSYRDESPLVSAICVGVVFVVAIMAFWFYDVLVEQKHARIMDRAIKASAIVESLFPKQVHDRLYEPMTDSVDHEHTTAASTNAFYHMDFSASSKRGTRRRRGGKTNPSSNSSCNSISSTDSKEDTYVVGYYPIVDSFPNTTIMFADIHGFAEWSVKNEPKDIFLFLEEWFDTLDHLASRYDVFKVETIGDCYLAATGIPEPQDDDHALRLTQFAQACLARASQVKLPNNGPNEQPLQLRIGLHSGPITAGILRGQKSRFQIFGDTVNTASRMETTGMAGKIQLSETTKQALIQQARAGAVEDWITPRDKLVYAKGKGYLQTYWCNPPAAPPSVAAGMRTTTTTHVRDSRSSRVRTRPASVPRSSAHHNDNDYRRRKHASLSSSYIDDDDISEIDV